MRALFTETCSPHVVLSLTFWLNSHLEHGGSSNLLILPGLLRSDLGGLSVSLLQENERMPVAYVGDVNSLPWNFISFPHKPSYSASFLHWIFSLSYPYLITLYIFNSIVSWSLKPSPLRIPWIHRGWTPVVLVGSYKNNVALWYKYAAKEPSNGSQHGEDLHSHHDLALGAVKVSGRFLARKAKEKLHRLRSPGIPGYSTKQWPSPCTQWWDPWAQNECPSQGKGERFPDRLHRSGNTQEWHS